MTSVPLSANGVVSRTRKFRLHTALALLNEAFDDAQSSRVGVWEFAVTLRALRDAGVRETDLRWLLAREMVEQATENLGRCKGPRAFSPTPDFTVTDRSCFVITARGRQVLRDRRLARQKARAAGSEPPEPPCWDPQRRELTWRGKLIKRFRTPALCQEFILAAFQEELWPCRIDDPLPGVPAANPKVRLHDTIKRLNRNQVHPLLSFRGDGTGRGVRWQPVGDRGRRGGPRAADAARNRSGRTTARGSRKTAADRLHLEMPGG